MKKTFSDKPMHTHCVSGAHAHSMRLASVIRLLRSMSRTFGPVLLGKAQHRDELVVHIETDLRGGDRGSQKMGSRMPTERLAQALVECSGALGSEVPA